MSDESIQIQYNEDLQPLRQLLARVERAGDFFVSGALELPLPKVEVAGVGVLSFPVPESQVAALINQAVRAPTISSTAVIVGRRSSATMLFEIFLRTLGEVRALHEKNGTDRTMEKSAQESAACCSPLVPRIVRLARARLSLQSERNAPRKSDRGAWIYVTHVYV